MVISSRCVLQRNMDSEDQQSGPPSVRCWDVWVVYLRVFLANLEVWFERFGQCIAKHPWKVIGMCFIGVIACCCGFLNIETESRADRLFVPKNSPSEKALRDGSPFFRNNMNSREEEVMLIPKNGSNIITPDCMREVINVTHRILHSKGFENVCLPKPRFLANVMQYDHRIKCAIVSPAEILKWKSSSALIMSKKFARANKDVTKLMSNGRAPVFNLQMMFADFKFRKTNETRPKPIATAKALRLIFYLKDSTNKETEGLVRRWEKNFVQDMKGYQKQVRCSNIYFSSARSLDDSIQESSSSDIALVSATFAIMIAFASCMMGRYTNPVRGHALLSFAGVFSTAMGIAAGIGLAAAFKVPFISLIGVMPFLVLSIGIDDMFIIVDDFDRTSRNHAPNKRVAESMSRIGATITMTTLTDVVAFVVSVQTSFPAIKYFCIYAAACITLEFVLQITFFVALLAFDARRIDNSRIDCFPTFKAEDKNKCGIPDWWSFSEKTMKFYSSKILSVPGKIVVLLTSATLLAAGIYGSIHVNKEFNRESLVLKNTYYCNYLKAFEEFFPQTIPVNLQVTSHIDYSNPSVQKQLLSAPRLAKDTGYYLPLNFSWMFFYKKWADSLKINTTGVYFNHSINAFLDSPSFRQHNLDVIRDNKGQVVASRILVFLKDRASSNFQRDAMLALRNKLHSLTIPLVSVADPFIFFEQFASVVGEVTKNLLFASLVIFALITPFCVHPVLVLLVVALFISLVVNLFGLMYLWGVSLDAISMINLVMSIGFAVDYSAHIAHAFITSTENSVDEKITDSLVKVGASVFMGGLSTFLGMLMTAFASSHIFQTFFKMFFGIVFFGLFNGMCVLPVLLSLFGRWMNTSVNTSTSYVVSAARFTWERIVGVFRRSKSEKKAPVKTLMDANDTKDISVVGVSARFPTAKGKEEFWNLLVEGRDTITEYPKNREARFRYFEDYFNPTRPVPGRLYVTKGSYMEDIELFDYKFFGISATEAKSMDPQQRILLQGTFEAIEDAGLKLEDLQRCVTGVYVGIMNLDYSSVVLRDDVMLTIDQFASTGTAFSIAANRISFSLNLTGPSIAIDTACSSSFSALSMACDHLRDGKCDVALVCAANLILCPKKQVTICRANMLSPDGRCKVFADEADGYGRGEGAVVLVLRRRDTACHSGDDVYCDIVSWGVNNDGQTAAPMTAPSEEGQKMLLEQILNDRGICPANIQYVEMHGTGTIIGDLVETKSVGEIYGKLRAGDKPLRVGSVKSNVNHTESAAGLAGLAKVCLMMKNKKYVATVNVDNLNPRLTLSEKGMSVQTSFEDWPENDNGLPRLASVNSFGYGGSNGHFVVKEPYQVTKTTQNEKKEFTGKKRVLVLSARSQAALFETSKQFSIWLRTFRDDDSIIRDILFSVTQRRSEHNHRLALGFHTLTSAAEILENVEANLGKKMKTLCYGQTTTSSNKVGFIFGGQGSQWRGMGADILSDSFIKQTIFKINYLAKHYGHKDSILDYLMTPAEDDCEDNMITTQLSIFSVEYAVAELLRKRAMIDPIVVGGHSLGDITASCVSGHITLKEAIQIIMARAELQSKCKSNGAMAALGLSTEEANRVLEELKLKDQVSIAAENDERNVTLSGDDVAINELDKYFTENRPKVFWRKLKVNKAFHSHHMEEIKNKFYKKLEKAGIKPRDGKIKMISSVEGKEIDSSMLTADYWWNNLRNPVLFKQCTEGFLHERCTLIIEISPRPVLSHYINNIVKQTGFDEAEDEIVVLQALPRLKEEERYNHLLVHCIGKIYTLGYPVSWKMLMDLQDGKFARYPTYAWQETPLWSFDLYANYERTMTLLGKPVRIKCDEKCWGNEIDTHNFEYLADHNMKAAGCILPGAAYLEMAFEAALEDSSLEPVIVRDLNFYNILPLPKQVVRMIRVTQLKERGSTFDNLQIANITEQSEIKLASAKIKAVPSGKKQRTLTLSEAIHLGDTLADRVVSHCGSSEGSDCSATDSGIATERQCTITTDPSSQSSAGFNNVEALDKCQSCCNDLAETEEELLELKKSFEDVLSSEEFNALASETGFDFGESFKLIEKAWCSKNSALVKLRIPDIVKKSLHEYVIHPSIIDATLQSCIAIKSTDRDKPVIPIGLEMVRLCPPKGAIKSLYAYTEVNTSIPDACDLKLMDNDGHALLYIHAFKVKDLRRSLRFPVFDKSIYKIDWVERTLQASQEIKAERHWFIMGVSKSVQVNNFIHALTQVETNPENIQTFDVRGSDSVGKFQENLLEHLRELATQDKGIVVVNLLPCIAQSINCEGSQAFSAQWLAFESSLETLKVLCSEKFEKSKLLIVTSASQGHEMKKEKRGICVPWGSTVWGLARVSNQEQGQIPTVCADVSLGATPEDFKLVIKGFDSPDAFEGFAVHEKLAYVPQFKRVKEDKEVTALPTHSVQSSDLYVAWSYEQQNFTVKEWVRAQEMKEDEVEVLVHYLSSSGGEISPLFENTKKTFAENIPYCFSGTIVRAGSEVIDFKAGDWVTGVTKSRWIQTTVRVPSDHVMLNTVDVDAGLQVSLAFCYAESYELLRRVKSAVAEGGNVFIVAPSKYRGVCYSTALLAHANGYHVTIDARLQNRAYRHLGVKQLDIQQVYRESLKPESSLKGRFHCLLYPADTHPLDVEAYVHTVKENGCLVALHVNGGSDSKGIRLSKAMTLFNVTLNGKQFTETKTVLNNWVSCLESLDAANLSKYLTGVPFFAIPLSCISEKIFLEELGIRHENALYSTLDLSSFSDVDVNAASSSLDIQGLKENRTYVVVGGSKGLGLDTVRWMAKRGAGTIITVSRSELPKDVSEEFRLLQDKYSAKVFHVKGDVSQTAGIELLEIALDKSDPLAGIVNSAVILDDKIFMDVDRENYRKVMGPKICGTIELHNMTERRKDKLDFFVMYSSITSVLGNTGQATYSASNAFMNSFADYRKHVLGKPCLSVCWGAMGGTGILERDFKTAAMLESRGLHLLHVQNGLEYLERVLTTMTTESCVSICDIEWGRYLKGQSEKRLQSPFLEHILRECSNDEEDSSASLLELLKSTKSIEGQREILRQFVSRWLAAWIGGSEEEIDMNVPLFTYGIDSVGASAIKAEVEKQLELSFEVFYFMQAETTGNKLVSDLLKAVREKISGKKIEEKEDKNKEQEEDDDGDDLKVPASFLQNIYSAPGQASNFFCIHPSHRYCGILLPIAQGFKFQKLFSLYTIGAQDPAYLSEDYESVRRLASAYIKLVKSVQEFGPYYIGGYSFGGLLALEMASILKEKGDKVELVVMIDTVRWIPKGRNNSQMLLQMYQEDSNPEIHIQAQLLGFMNKIGTLQLGIRVEDFEEMVKTKTFDEMIDTLKQKAEEAEKSIPDLRGIYESTARDQQLAAKCHQEWEPSKFLYDGSVLYIHAQDDEFCKSVPGLGSAVDCWKSVLEGNIDVIGAPGNHYSMLNVDRAADIGQVIATAALIRYRRTYSTTNRIPMNNCQYVAVKKLKTGAPMSLYNGKGANPKVIDGKTKLSKKMKKLKFIPNSSSDGRKVTIPVTKIFNIVKISASDFPMRKRHKYSYCNLPNDDFYAGLSLRCSKGQIFNLLCYNRQDYTALVDTLRAVLSLPLP